ncbi:MULTISPECIES: phasin family protein [Thalassospira]|nr:MULTISPECIES: phasin family protein [Thalassospira]MDG4721283.1 phasin family protein [Thalassospira sp. FZY0004]
MTTSSKPATATKKAATPSAPKKAAAPKKVAAVTAAKPAMTESPKPVVAKVAGPKPVSEPAKASPKVDDAFGFGAMFMAPDAMDKYLALWKAPELDAMMSAGTDAFEESMSVANEAFTKLFDTMTGQSDVFSDAGSRMAAQCEELFGTHQKNVEEFWQTSMALFEKTGGIGTELATWMQREIEASQADIDALTKAESVSDIQELQSKIMTRYVESTVAESEKVQEIMFAAMTDSFNAMSKAAGAVMK